MKVVSSLLRVCTTVGLLASLKGLRRLTCWTFLLPMPLVMTFEKVWCRLVVSLRVG